MAKRKKIRKHVIKLDELTNDVGFVLIGIQTNQALYRLAFDFNYLFSWDLHLQDDLKVIRKDKEVSFENYATSENTIGQKIRLLNNEILIPIAHPNTLFDTNEAYYLFSKLPAINYILMLPEDEGLDYKSIQQNFQVTYPVKFIEVDLVQCGTAFPVFPV